MADRLEVVFVDDGRNYVAERFKLVEDRVAELERLLQLRAEAVTIQGSTPKATELNGIIKGEQFILDPTSLVYADPFLLIFDSGLVVDRRNFSGPANAIGPFQAVVDAISPAT